MIWLGKGVYFHSFLLKENTFVKRRHINCGSKMRRKAKVKTWLSRSSFSCKPPGSSYSTSEHFKSVINLNLYQFYFFSQNFAHLTDSTTVKSVKKASAIDIISVFSFGQRSNFFAIAAKLEIFCDISLEAGSPQNKDLLRHFLQDPDPSPSPWCENVFGRILWGVPLAVNSVEEGKIQKWKQNRLSI